MSDDEKDICIDDLKPQGVTGETAETFLLAAGWVQQGDHWLAPGSSVAFPRGKAVVLQFQRDLIRLSFVMMHAPPEAIMMLIPPSALQRLLAAFKARAGVG